MTRPTTAARRRRSGKQRGLTLVEVLVTVVVAGLFFAAMVPVFVLAGKQGSTDRTRIVAANLAQARIEAIRSMAYDSIDAARLARLEAYGRDDPGFDPRFDGPWKDPDKPGKSYAVTYMVEEILPSPLPAGVSAADYPHRYKLVTVTVTWRSAPDSTRSLRLTTAIYRQTTGPELLGLSVTPVDPARPHLITSGRMVVRAEVNGLDTTVTDYVWFTVYANNGSQVATGQVVNDTLRRRAVYEWSWDADAARAPDGPYTFMALAVADRTGQPGNVIERQYFLDRQAPATPVWAADQVVAGSGAVMVVWAPQPAVGDLDRYEVERTAPDGTRRLFPEPGEGDGLPRWSTTLVDGAGLQGGGTYTYRVRAWDTSDRPSEWSEPLQLTVGPVSGGELPAPPAGVIAQQLTNTSVMPAAPLCSARITWQRSQSLAQPDDAGVSYYFVYRTRMVPVEPGLSPALPYSTPLSVMRVVHPATSYSTDDPTVDWDASYQYAVSAATADLRVSARATSGLVRIVPPTGTLGLKLFASVPQTYRDQYPGKWYARFSVVWLETGQVFPAGGITAIRDKVWADDPNSSYSLSGLPFGSYQVVASFYIQGKTADQFMGWASRRVQLLAPGQPETITFVR